jgi:hypothetical protein
MHPSSPDTREYSSAGKRWYSLSVKNPAKKVTAITETTNMKPATRRAQGLNVFRRRG